MPKINITVNIHESIYLRNPLETTLGKTMIREAIILFEEIGFENLNFKKLAARMNSSEASLYRYFENKYKLLTYLVSWYWDFMHFMLLMDIRNIDDPRKKLDTAINTLVNSLVSAATPDYVNQAKLHAVVVENASKVYHTKDVDKLSKEGYYQNYSKLISTLSSIILEIDNKFVYPNTLATNIIEQSLTTEYYLEHLPTLTDTPSGKFNSRQETIKMVKYMLDRIL